MGEILKLCINFRNKFAFPAYDENDDQLQQSPVSRQTSIDPNDTNDSSSAASSPKILKRQSHLVKRSSSEIEPEEQAPPMWHNLPKEIWKTAAEVNNPN